MNGLYSEIYKYGQDLLLTDKPSFADDTIQHDTGNDVLDSIDDGVEFGLVNVIAADGQGDGPRGFQIDDGAEATLLYLVQSVKGVGWFAITERISHKQTANLQL